MPANPLTLRDREEIRAGIIREESAVDIGSNIGRHRCTVSNEITRNGGREKYRAHRAHEMAAKRRRRPKARRFERCPALAAHVAARLEAKDSPMTIAVELKRGLFPDVDATVSHETIYRAIYDHSRGGLPADVLKHLHRRRRYRNGRHLRRSPLWWRQTMTSISQRPPEAHTRSEVGHLEGDLIIGKAHGSAIITVFDRSSRYLWMAGLPDSHAATPTLKALTKLLKRVPPQLRRTLTWDQGSEMARHAELSQRCNIDVYFADAHSPWQRPTNENGNRLIRRYVGKGTDLAVFTPTDLRAIETRINTIPRRVLEWSTAKQVYDQAVAMTT